MGFAKLFGGSKKHTTPVQPAAPEIKNAEAEKEEAKKKARLLETEGQNKGAQLAQSQGQTLRKVFGN